MGKRVLQRGGGGNPKIQVISSGTGAEHKAGIMFYSSATGGCYLMVDNTGTGIHIGT
jgi:hypothetical protein